MRLKLEFRLHNNLLNLCVRFVNSKGYFAVEKLEVNLSGIIQIDL